MYTTTTYTTVCILYVEGEGYALKPLRDTVDREKDSEGKKGNGGLRVRIGLRKLLGLLGYTLRQCTYVRERCTVQYNLRD